MVARGWTDEQKRGYLIADNKLTENGGWDEALLKLEIADLAALGFDLPIMGFSESELARLTGSNPRLTRSRRGARAAGCPGGAARRPLATRPAFARLRGRDQRRRRCAGARRRGAEPDGDRPAVRRGLRSELAPRAGINLNAKKLGTGGNDDRADWRAAWALFPGAVAYVWHAGRYANTVQEAP